MITSESNRTSYTQTGTATTSTEFDTPAPIYATSDVEVYVNGAKKALTTNYTVTIDPSDNTANVKFVSGSLPVDSDVITIVRALPYLQGQNFINNDALDIENVETGLDKITVMTQQLADGKDYSFKFAKELATAEFNDDPVLGTNFENRQDRATTLSATKTTRANKYVGFDENGDISVSGDIGIYRGDWVTGTAYVVKDLVKQNSDSDSVTKSNIYICTAKHDSTGSYLTENDTANWTLLLDVATATGGIEESKAWATKVDGIVSASTGADDFSSKAYAIGGTGVDNVAGSAKDWAIETGSTPSSTATDASAKEWAIGSSSHKSEYSAKEYAIGDETASGGSAKAWAIDGSSPDGTSEKSAKTLAGESATSATASATSATASATSATASATSATASATSATASETAKIASELALDTFDDRFLGAKSSAPTVDNDGNAIIEGALYWHSTSKKLYVWNDTSNTWVTLTAAADANSITGANTITSSDGNDLTLATNADGENVVINASTGSNYFKLPNVRGPNTYVLTRDDDEGTGGTTWKETVVAPTITSVTGEINEDTSTTLTVAGNGFATGMALKLINASTSADITGHTSLSYSGSTSPLTVTIPSATTNLTAGLQVKLHISKSGLTVQSDAITVSEDPIWDSTFVTNKATFATIDDYIDASSTVGTLDADAGAGGGTIVYASDDSSLNSTYFSLATSTGVITTTSTALTGLTSGGNFTEAFNANAKISGSEATKNTLLSGINIIVTKSPTGGDIINTNDWVSDYRIHVFETGGSLVVYADIDVDILVVGGGGSGASEYAGGGGAGGLVYMAGHTLTANTYDAVIGNGGAGQTTDNEDGNPGGDTTWTINSGSVLQFVAKGGGSGGGESPGGTWQGGPGGCGGGASWHSSGVGGTTTQAGTSQGVTPDVSIGYAGGDGVGATSYNMGGGGGAGGAGQNATQSKSGNGGLGRDYGSIFGTAVGDSGWFASGGGGGWTANGNKEAGTASDGGGSGGGTPGGGDSDDAQANTGGGSGGGASQEGVGPTGNSGDGGSGIVIVRYAI